MAARDSVERIRCEDLTFGYGREALLAPVSLRVRQGEFWSVVGNNGSGKSTFLRTLLGLHAALGGTVTRETDRVSYLPQERDVHPRLPMRVDAWIATGLIDRASAWRPWAARAERESVAAVARRVQCESLVRKQVRSLSVGQRQRTSMARALVSAPKLLILDEPMSAMDPPTQLELLAVLRAYCDDGGAAMVVSHDVDRVARFATHTLRLDRSAVVAQRNDEATA